MNYLSKIGFFHYLLNMQYPIFIRFFIALFYFFVCMIVSFDYKLSFLFLKRVLFKNDLKSESRRLVWILKRKSLIIKESTDLMFDFCNGLDFEEFSIIKSFFMRSINPVRNIFLELDLLKILAYEVNFIFDNKPNEIFYEKFKDQYFKVKKFLNKKNMQKYNILKINKKNFSKKNSGISSKKAQKVLFDVTSLFKKNKIEWFPISGTFLGFIREESFLGHDLDIDIGLISNDKSFKRIIDIFNKNKILKISKIEYQKYFFNKNNYFKRPTFARIIHKNGINVDLYFHFISGNSIFHGTSSILWENTLFEFSTYKIYGIYIKGPANSDLYLSETYGDWKNEKINYDFHRDMLSLKGAPNHLGLEYLLRRKLYCGKEPIEQISVLEKLIFK